MQGLMWFYSLVALVVVASSSSVVEAAGLSLKESVLVWEAGKGAKFIVDGVGNAGSDVLLNYIENSEGSVLLKDVALKKEGKGYVVELSKEQTSVGIYKLQVTAGTEKKLLVARVASSVEIENARVLGNPLSFGSKLAKVEKLSSGSGDKFTASLRVKSKANGGGAAILPQHAVIEFTSAATGKQTLFLLDRNSDSLQASIDLSKHAKTLDYDSGNYAVRIILSDAAFVKPLTWDIGSVHLSLAARPVKRIAPLYSEPLLHESDTTLKALPEIKHVMRPADSRPNILFSLIFTLLSVAPLLGFLMFSKVIGVRMSKVPTGIALIWALAFFGLFGSILSLLFMYWLRLTMYKTLYYMSFLGIGTIFVGHRALRHHAAESAIKSKTA